MPPFKFIPAHESAIAFVVTSDNGVTTIPTIAWLMMSRGNGEYVAKPILPLELAPNAGHRR